MPTKSYAEALKRTANHHATQNKTFSGQFTWKRRKKIKEIIDAFGVETILDYGCGKGKQYNFSINKDDEGRSLEEYWAIKPHRYDPGVPQYSADPVGKFDLVICVQVLGSIPTSDLPWVIDRMYQYANKAIYVTERIKSPAKPIYADMKDAMPRDLSAEDWMNSLRRPGSPIRLFVDLRYPDEVLGWKGWRRYEPEDQG